MKSWICFLVFLVLSTTSIAQQDTTPLYKRFAVIPPFSLLKSDGTSLTKDQLKKNQPTIIMFFNPDCDHCEHQIQDMIKRMDDLRKIQIVLATYKPIEELTAFQTKYKLKQYDNIRAGRDTKFFLVPYYRIRNLPYLALYDKKGNLITTFEGNVTVEKLVQAFR